MPTGKLGGKKEPTIHIIPRRGVSGKFLLRTRRVRADYEVDTKKTIKRAIRKL